jgi:hypothetical protein
VKKVWLALLAMVGLALALACGGSGGSGSSGGYVHSGKTYLATNVVILVLDGPRQSEMWGDPTRANIPHLKELAPSGTLLPGFQNAHHTYTMAGHTAILTGAYQEYLNVSTVQHPDHAGIFQHFLQASGLDRKQAWIVSSKDTLALLGDTEDAAWRGQEKYQPSVWCGKNGGAEGNGEDEATVAKAEEILLRDRPRLMLISLKQPDSAAHGRVWEDYLAALKTSDAYAAEIWNALQADPVYAGRTDLFITHDHGRHLDGIMDGFISHGDDCAGCRHVALLALGPDIKAGVEIASGGELIDVAPTVAELLGFDLPDAQGRLLGELLK